MLSTLNADERGLDLDRPPHIPSILDQLTYGVLLNRMGFTTERLLYAIAVISPRAENIQGLRREIVRAVIKNGPKEAVLRFKEARIYVNKFDIARMAVPKFVFEAAFASGFALSMDEELAS